MEQYPLRSCLYLSLEFCYNSYFRLLVYRLCRLEVFSYYRLDIVQIGKRGGVNDPDCLVVDLFGAELFYNNRVLLIIDLKLSPFERPKGLLYIFNRIKNDCIEGRSARGHSFEAKWFFVYNKFVEFGKQGVPLVLNLLAKGNKQDTLRSCERLLI